MANRLVNLAGMETATTGIGTITLTTALYGLLTFDDAGVLNGDVISYSIQNGAQTEVGTGTYTTATKTLTRTAVTNSTNAGNKIILSGTSKVYVTCLASDINPISQTLLQESGGSLYMGGLVNGIKVDTGGELQLIGSATMYDDSMIPATSFRAGGTGLNFAQFTGNIFMYRFDVGDIFYVQVQLPHAMKVGTVIHPHIHFAVNSAIGATGYNVEVTTESSWANIDQVFSVPSVVGSGLVLSFKNQAQYTHKLLELTDMTPVATQGGISSYVIFKVERITASVEPLNPAASLFVLGMDIHYELDTMGSKEEFIK